MQIKNDLFMEDSEADRLVELRKYMDVYDKCEAEVHEMIVKYQQQEQVI